MKNLLNNIIDIAFSAGEAVLEHYGDTSFIKKIDDSPLTKADIESNKIITQNLQKISPFKINSEEDELDYHKRAKEKYLWLIDPLDGTKDFIAKNDEWTINIALLKQNIPILGVVYAPALKKMYFALDKNGAFLLEDSTNIKNARNITSTRDSTNLIALTSRFHSTKNTDNFIKRYNLTKQTLGSSLKMCAIAEGKADIYPRFNGTKEWDIAASDIIIKESGGIMLDFITKKPLLYNKQDLKNNHFIAFSKSQINKQIYNDFMENKIGID